MSSTVCTENRCRGSTVIPVRATKHNGIMAEVEARESKVVGAERVVNLHDVAEVVGDAAVKADAVV